MDPQTIERAIKHCIDISVRLGALEEEVPPRPGASSSSAWTRSMKCSDGSKTASEHAGGRFGRSARAGRRTDPHEESRIRASDRQEPTRRPRRNDAHALTPQRPVRVRPQHRHHRLQIRKLHQVLIPSFRRRPDRPGNRLRLTALNAGPLGLAGHRRRVEAADAHHASLSNRTSYLLVSSPAAAYPPASRDAPTTIAVCVLTEM